MTGSRGIVILGAARQGQALARFLLGEGATVTLSDAKRADVLDLSSLPNTPRLTLTLGGHPLALLDGAEAVYLSGGVPIDLPIVVEARRRRIPLSNDAQLFFERCPLPITAITGSAGKTTTTTLVGKMLSLHEAGPEGRGRAVWVGGNIGNPLVEALGRIRPGDAVVMELSSFQLELMTRSPRIACITNITPNHLDRHGTMQAYIAAKRRILDFQGPGDRRVLSADDPVTSGLGKGSSTDWFSLRDAPSGDGAWLDGDGFLRMRVAEAGIESKIVHRKELCLMGAHNILNVLAAALVAARAGAGLEAIRSVARSFRGVEHRLQLVREWHGTRWYDDSIATAPERLLAALQCFDAPVVLLAGGRDKKLPWESAAAEMARRCRHVVLFGEMGPMVAEKLAAAGLPASRMTQKQRLEDAVTEAAAVVRPGDVVLLSPGGTSYDAFQDFAQRGDCFSTLVNALA